MANLYDLTQDALYLQELLEAGDIDETTYNDTLEGLSITTKLENICKIIKNLEADAVKFKTEKDRLAQRQKTAENSIIWLKKSLLNYLTAMNVNNAGAGIFKFGKTHSKAVNIIDEKIIPEKYLIAQPPKVDKTSIKDDIRNGVLIPGAEIVENTSIRIK